MMNSYSLKYVAGAALIMFLVAACGPTDTVRVVDQEPRTLTPVEVADDDTLEQFKQIKVGITDTVTNFDPLFADNLSTKRILSLIYDGLFTLDRDGEPIPAMAKSVEISDDSLEYTITLNRDLFYHDKQAFTSGVGRRVQAADVKWAFERTARRDVPPTAGKLLMNIAGYESFLNEQRHVYESSKRVLDGVGGIEVVNQETIRFHLIDPDPDFKKKLASPYLFIYPREAFRSGFAGLAEIPVGTGAYKYERKEGDGRIILSRDESTRAANRLTSPRINRIDFITKDHESDLFQEFSQGNIHWIPEIGPGTSLLVTDGEGNLQESYKDNNIRATNINGQRTTYLSFNDRTRHVQLQWLKNRTERLDFAQLNFHADYEIKNAPATTENDDEPDEVYYVAYTENIFARHLLSLMDRIVTQPDSEFNLITIRVPTYETAMYTHQSDSFHHPYLFEGSGYWVKVSTPITSVSRRSVTGIRSHAVPWKLFMEPVRVPAEEQEPS